MNSRLIYYFHKHKCIIIILLSPAVDYEFIFNFLQNIVRVFLDSLQNSLYAKLLVIMVSGFSYSVSIQQYLVSWIQLDFLFLVFNLFKEQCYWVILYFQGFNLL